jgi:hypothetical protein
VRYEYRDYLYEDFDRACVAIESVAGIQSEDDPNSPLTDAAVASWLDGDAKPLSRCRAPTLAVLYPAATVFPVSNGYHFPCVVTDSGQFLRLLNDDELEEWRSLDLEWRPEY